VVGTTGWNEQKDEIFSYCKQHQKALFYASNFSIGVNLFFELNKHLAQMMKNYSDYNVHIEETHHLQKLDKPSGTAITLAEGLEVSAPIESIRKEDVFGIHKVFYTSEQDIIEIKHEAKSRQGFAKGAVCAAEWLLDKKGVFTMTDMLNQKKL
jgi:4-hydroxy-tetrahydrodipicolinate reductase